MSLSTPLTSPARLIDVARRAGVGRSSAAKVLLGTGGRNTRVSPATADRIRQIAAELGFRPNPIARQLKGVRSHTLGLIIHHGVSPLLSARLIRMEQEAWHRGFRVMIGHGHGDDHRIDHYLSDFYARGVEGIIALDFWSDGRADGYEAFARIPHVVFQGHTDVDIPGCASVRLDRAWGVRQAVAHLVERGRRRIGLALNTLSSPNMMDRQSGYQAGLADHGIPLDPALVWPGNDQRGNTFDQMLDDLVLTRRPQAVILPSDEWAVALLKRLGRMGIRVPQDLAVVGFDNRDIAAAVEPELTTVDQEIPAVAAAAVDALTSLLDGRDLPEDRRRVAVKPRLVIRAST
jgi:DNA-binding LacI/PurR family transcriptional regulator